MAEVETTVGPEEGIHGRPAAQFVKAAKGFSSQVVIVKGDREVNAKSVLKMTGLARKGDKITIRAEGEDAEQAVETLAQLIAAEEH
jgi:phosphotransferase system HPr (HPr) family protein